MNLAGNSVALDATRTVVSDVDEHIRKRGKTDGEISTRKYDQGS